MLSATPPQETQQEEGSESSAHEQRSIEQAAAYPPHRTGAWKCLAVVEMWKRHIRHGYAEECTQRFPTLFHLINQQFFGWHVALNFIIMLIEHRDGICFLLKAAMKCV